MKHRAMTRLPLCLLLALGGSAGLLAACSSDLFHSTDWASLCDKQPDAGACQTKADAGDAGETGGGGAGGGVGGSGGMGGAGGAGGGAGGSGGMGGAGGMT